ncbi:hypothetical protein THMIRHAM_17210 [Thiomicrorhabdus immobilis]|uniref:ORC1/DEAH AAA+ ATPase domain-containing protein n=1 Tax=Thiomicrorhabdus immobilis TaxID=2791037 RepID=A0ABN6CY57_9GAMM|nr:AAA family ATPase [Thiomicrorhabdus immobilis]BCN93936.1 hypothetical protein THMIRHAM_17210 [Thiomicrorhabdus immobilis]
MYQSYFDLKSLPFKTTPDLELFYKNGSREEILEALIYTVTRGDGIIKVTGEVGSGKTMLLRLLASKLPSQFEVVYINSPNLSAMDIVLYICSELKIPISNSDHKFTLTNALNHKLLELHSMGRKVVMLVDEAQSMTYDGLEELRLLSNIETDKHKLLQIVLFGQPELDVAIENPKIRQLKSRISYNIYVPPLSSEDVQAYLNHRMRKCGYTGLDVFGLPISKKIQKITDGLPRNINILADKLLMILFGSGDKVVTDKHLRSISRYEFNSRDAESDYLNYILLSVVFIVLITVVVYLFIPSKDIGLVPANTVLIEQSNGYKQTSKIVEQATVGKLPKEDSQAVVQKLLNISNTNKGEIKLIGGDKINGNRSSETKQTNYRIENPSAILNDKEALLKILSYHSKARDWLLNLDDGYVIQLSTRHIRSLDTILTFFDETVIDPKSLYILIDYNKDKDVYRLKVFYKSSVNFKSLQQELVSLPKRLKRSGPYIITTKQLVQNLHSTDLKLKEIGIINE